VSADRLTMRTAAEIVAGRVRRDRGKGFVRLRRRAALWACVGVALLFPVGRGLASAPGVWPTVLTSWGFTVPVASGVRYTHFAVTTSDGPLDIHHLIVDVSNSTVRLGVGLAHNRLMSPDETVSSMARRAGAVAGINADFFDIRDSGMPLNIVVRDGRLLRSPVWWAALAIGKDGSVRIVRFQWTGSLVLPVTQETHALDGYNSGLVPNGIIAISDVRGYGAPVPEPGTRQTVAELVSVADSSSFRVNPDTIVVLPSDHDESRYVVRQVWPQQAFYAPFPQGEIILVGRGSGADWLAQKMTPGTMVQVNLATDPDWHLLQGAVGGGPVLVQDGQIADDPHPPAALERYGRLPVIAAGIDREGRTLMLTEVDGRQPHLSIGLTQAQLAAYMQRMGAFQAMAFDSGGSATVVARLPGQPLPTVVNSPSDRRERPVADALLVFSTATPGPAESLFINANQPLLLYKGATAPLSVFGVDARGNPVDVPGPLEVTAQPPLITVTPQGVLQAGMTAGTGVLQVSRELVNGTVPFSVVERLSGLVVSPPAVSVTPGLVRTFTLAGRDAEGHPVALPDRAGVWQVRPRWLGTFFAPGRFVAGDLPGRGTIEVEFGGAIYQVQVTVRGTARSASHLPHTP
jgi:exopolysaccharide biosynthesis protein